MNRQTYDKPSTSCKAFCMVRKQLMVYIRNLTSLLRSLARFQILLARAQMKIQPEFLFSIPSSFLVFYILLSPNSIPPVIFKIAEKVVSHVLFSVLNANNLLSPRQSGFRTNFSIETAVTFLCERNPQKTLIMVISLGRSSLT